MNRCGAPRLPEGRSLICIPQSDCCRQHVDDAKVSLQQVRGWSALTCKASMFMATYHTHTQELIIAATFVKLSSGALERHLKRPRADEACCVEMRCEWKEHVG